MYTYKGKMLFYNNVFFGELLGQMMKKWKKRDKNEFLCLGYSSLRQAMFKQAVRT